MNALEVNNLDGDFLTFKQMAEKCNFSIETVKKLAKESGSVIAVSPRIQRVDKTKFYDYLREHYAANND